MRVAKKKLAEVINIATAVEKKKEKGGSIESLKITPPNFKIATLLAHGTAPYVQHAFSEKARNQMADAMRAGQQSRSKRKRDPRDFKAGYENAMHISRQGWHGIPAAAFRNAMISAAKTCGFKMTLAKLSIFIIPDGFDRASGDPLVRITRGKPHEHWSSARNANGGTDIRCRPMWDDGWQANVQVRWDLDQFSASDVVNLFSRAGAQVGIGEGRADSPNSNGLGWGHFEVKS